MVFSYIADVQTQDHLTEILEALSKAGVDFIVAGGVAIVLHGVERATMDLDLSVKMDDSNLKQFLSVMKKSGLVPRVPLPPEALLDPDQRRQMVETKKALVFTFIHPEKPYQQVDVFIAKDLDYEKLEAGADRIDLGDIKVRVLSKKQLVSLKKQITPARDKDRFDVAALEKLMAEEGE